MADTSVPIIQPASQHVIKGVALVVLATLLFGACDVLGKHLTTLYAVPFIMAVRYVINASLLAVILGPVHGAGLWRSQRTGLVILRGLCLTAGSLTMGLALHLMPVGETVAIIYLAPFIVMLLAGRLMGEVVTPVGWLLAICGFAGVLLIMRPGSGLDPWGVGFALISMGCTAAYTLLTRLLAKSETTVAMVFTTAMIGALVFLVLTLIIGPGKLPDATGWVWLVVMGVMATIGHLVFTAAYREAPASTLAPVNYLHIVWAGILGWLVFVHVPDSWALLGMAMVLFSGASVAVLARRG